MHITISLAAAFALASLAAASLPTVDIARRESSDIVKRTQPGHPGGPAASNTNSETVVQIVTVGDNNGSLKFFPENIKAEVGSVVQFQFYPKNHTITESTFANPCKPMPANISTPERPGQRSGFVPVTPNTEFRPVYNMIVNDTKPIWIFCGQMPHCQKGMVMVINQNDADPEKTLEKYKAAAAQVPMPSPAASAPPAASTSTVTSTAKVSTVTPPPGGQNTAGPSLIGSTTSPAAAQSGTGTGTAVIATFTGAAKPVHELPALGLLAAGAAFALW